MRGDMSDEQDLLERARGGDCGALAELFQRHRGRPEQMVRLRLDRRLQGRLDPADVLQEAYLDVARRFPEYAADPALPFFLWLRLLTGQRLVDLHRQHLGPRRLVARHRRQHADADLSDPGDRGRHDPAPVRARR